MTKDEDLRTLQDLLSLVLSEKPPSLTRLAALTPGQRADAEKWAASCHLRASDNPVRVPPRPPWLKDYR